MKQNPKLPTQRIALSFIDRVSMLACIVGTWVTYLYVFFYMSHYNAMALPSVYKTATLYDSPYKEQHYLYNGLLYSSFYVQHIVLALVSVKIKLWGIFKKYPLYERYIYNISSSVILSLIFYNARPIAAQSEILFRGPVIPTTIISGLAEILYLYTMYLLGKQLLHPYSFKSILTAKEIQFNGYSQNNLDGLIINGIYGYVRHPMQCSLLLMFLFGSNQYTVDRLIFIAVNAIGIITGVLFEQNRLRKKFKQYANYQKIVKYRFIPFIL